MTEGNQQSRTLHEARSGSRDALSELYRRHANGVFTLAYRITGSRADAEDVLQDVFVGLPRALASYDEHGRFESWLRRVTARTALMRMRAGRRRREDSLEMQPQQAAGGAGAVAAVEGQLLERLAVERALTRLPQNLRTVFLLKEIEGYAHDEIAELLEISAGASATRLSRAWSLLRKELST